MRTGRGRRSRLVWKGKRMKLINVMNKKKNNNKWTGNFMKSPKRVPPPWSFSSRGEEQPNVFTFTSAVA